MTELRDTQGRFAPKPLEELSYRRWHSRLGELREKIGRCACGIEPTEWSYIGSDPRGWEPDPALYIEECRSCNISRSDKVGRYDRNERPGGMTGRRHTPEARAKMRGPRKKRHGA